MFCPKCGAQTVNGARFCPTCGFDMGQATTPQQHPMAQQTYQFPVQPQQQSVATPVAPQRQKSHKGVIAVVVALLVVAVAGAAYAVTGGNLPFGLNLPFLGNTFEGRLAMGGMVDGRNIEAFGFEVRGDEFTFDVEDLKNELLVPLVSAGGGSEAAAIVSSLPATVDCKIESQKVIHGNIVITLETASILNAALDSYSDTADIFGYDDPSVDAALMLGKTMTGQLEDVFEIKVIVPQRIAHGDPEGTFGFVMRYDLTKAESFVDAMGGSVDSLSYGQSPTGFFAAYMTSDSNGDMALEGYQVTDGYPYDVLDITSPSYNASNARASSYLTTSAKATWENENGQIVIHDGSSNDTYIWFSK